MSSKAVKAHFYSSDSPVREGRNLVAVCGVWVENAQFLSPPMQTKDWRGKKIKDLFPPESQEAQESAITNCQKCRDREWQGSIVYQIASRRKEREAA